ncbi:MAG: DUF4391 domain-containing protein [Treponema sp.]|nr:DUF4391 domain-containing protein [Treponema sp.]
MLNLPESTEVRQRINKTAIYRKFSLDNAQQAKFDEDISTLIIVNEVSSQTIKLSGSDENSFFVLEVLLKHKDYDKKNIERLSKLIDQNLLLVLRYEDSARLAVFKTVLHETEWKSLDELSFTLNGLNFDSMWENVIRTVGGIEQQAETTLEEQINLNIEKSKVQKQIDVLKKKMKNEKQLNRQLEIKSEIKKLEGMIK